AHRRRPETPQQGNRALARLLANHDRGACRIENGGLTMRRTVRIDTKNRSAKDVEREIALHLELRAREFEAEGMTPEAARAAALEAFGDRQEIQSEVTEIRERTIDRRRSQ